MRKRPEDSASPDLTPMIDCVFQLIIFFMVGCKFQSLDGLLQTHLPKTLGQVTDASIEQTPHRLALKVAGDYVIQDGRRVVRQIQVILNDQEYGVYTRKEFGRDAAESEALLDTQRRIFARIAARLTELSLLDAPGCSTPLIIDPDLRVPADDIIQAVDAACIAKIFNVTFAGGISDIDRMYAEDGIER